MHQLKKQTDKVAKIALETKNAQIAAEDMLRLKLQSDVNKIEFVT